MVERLVTALRCHVRGLRFALCSTLGYALIGFIVACIGACGPCGVSGASIPPTVASSTMSLYTTDYTTTQVPKSAAVSETTVSGVTPETTSLARKESNDVTMQGSIVTSSVSMFTATTSTIQANPCNYSPDLPPTQLTKAQLQCQVYLASIYNTTQVPTYAAVSESTASNVTSENTSSGGSESHDVTTQSSIAVSAASTVTATTSTTQANPCNFPSNLPPAQLAEAEAKCAAYIAATYAPELSASAEKVTQVYTEAATQAQLLHTGQTATAVNFQTVAEANQVYSEVATQAQLLHTDQTATAANFQTVAEANQVYSEVATQAQVYTEIATQAQLQNASETATSINFISDAAIATFLEINSKTINSLSEVTLMNEVSAFDVSDAQVITVSSKNANGAATFANLPTITDAVLEEISTNSTVTNGIPYSFKTETTPTVTAPTVSQASSFVTPTSLHSSLSSTTSRSTAKTNPAVQTTLASSTTVLAVIQTSTMTANRASTVIPVNVLSSSFYIIYYLI